MNTDDAALAQLDRERDDLDEIAFAFARRIDLAREQDEREPACPRCGLALWMAPTAHGFHIACLDRAREMI